MTGASSAAPVAPAGLVAPVCPGGAPVRPGTLPGPVRPDSPHPPSDALTDPVVARTRALAVALLAPAAATTAESQVPRSHLDALGAAGALGTAVYRPAGPHTPAQVQRAVSETIAAADGATWCVFAQHHHPLREVAASPAPAVRERWLDPMTRGRVLAAVATSHLRRPGPPAVTAVRDGDGWRLHGRLAWLTGWGIADVVLVGALTPDDRILFALLDCDERAGLTDVRPHRLWSMAATGTVSARLDAVAVAPDRLVALHPGAGWRRADAARRPNVNPGVFGTIAAACACLTGAGNGPEYLELGRRIAAEASTLRTTAYRLMDEVPAHEATTERLAVRAAALELAGRAATACVAAGGGASATAGSLPARLLAEASFHLVQAQTAESRTATGARMLAVTNAVTNAPTDSATNALTDSAPKAVTDSVTDAVTDSAPNAVRSTR
ncbi:acyl-CoA dehydrogenase [Streptomyces sp. NPDC059456]|uniref:acyl-CoA dehydrogenase n=1 Tax=Streptomyces sp. NPDC059456 TaxID=3346838 RepID=UPI00369CBF92